MLRSDQKICEAFRVHFRDVFARLPDLLVQDFRSYLADLARQQETKAANCEGIVTDSDVCDVLKQVGLSKSPGLDGFLYELYLKLSYMFMPILMDTFNHWLPRKPSLDMSKGR